MREIKTLTAFGTTRTIVEWAAARGLKYATISARIESGWSIPRALRAETQVHRQRNGKWRAFGEMHTPAEWSRKTGIHYNTLTNRVWKLGLTIEAALTCEKYYDQKSRRKKNCVNGHPLTGSAPNRSCKECSAKRREEKLIAGLPQRTHGTRLALAALRASIHDCQWRAFGRSRTITQWASEYGISRSTLYGRLQRGSSIEAALKRG